jgi:protein-L-isoaspartate O-methyltransferase
MLTFHPNIPFPLLAEGAYSYAEAQSHSERVDRWLGLQTSQVEEILSLRGCLARAPNATRDHQQLWIGLATQNLLTPYIEIRRILESLKMKSGETVIDLGAGYGRMGFIIGRHHPEIQFVGYEFVGERLREAKKCLARMKFTNVRMEHADLNSPSFTPASAEYYFIYDYGKPAAIEKTLHDLRRIAEARRNLGQTITVVARGKTCQQSIASRHSWLKKICTSEPNGRSSIYRTRDCASLEKLRELLD